MNLIKRANEDSKTDDEKLIEQVEASIKELEELEEKFYPGRHNLNIETDDETIEKIQKRMEAASRALGLVNKIKDRELKSKHLSRVISNMNTIRAALQYMTKNLPVLKDKVEIPTLTDKA